MFWYPHLFQNFPQFVVIYTVQGFRIVNEAEVDVFLEFPCFFSEPATRPGADCVSDHELLIAKFRLKLKKVGKTPRPFRYDLNHRFKGLDLTDKECLKNYGWKFITLNRRQKPKSFQRKRNARRQSSCW